MVMAQEEEEAATEPVEEVVNEEEGSRDKVEEQRPAAGTAEAEAVGVRVATSPELTGLVERLKVQLEKERAEKETLMSRVRRNPSIQTVAALFDRGHRPERGARDCCRLNPLICLPSCAAA